MTADTVDHEAAERFRRFLERVRATGDVAAWAVGNSLFLQADSFESSGRREDAVKILERLIKAGLADASPDAQVLAAWGRFVRGAILARAGQVEKGAAEFEQLEMMGVPALAILNNAIAHYRVEAERDNSARFALAAAMSTRVRVFEHLPGATANEAEAALDEFLDEFEDAELDEIGVLASDWRGGVGRHDDR